MDCQGQVVVANYLGNLCKKGIRGNSDVEMEMEILKFFKKSLSNKVCIFISAPLIWRD